MPFTSISAGWIFTLMGLLDDGRPLNQGKSQKLYTQLLTSGDNHVTTVANRFMGGSKEIKRIFADFVKKWCNMKKQQLLVTDYDEFARITEDMFDMVLDRIQDEVEHLYPLLREVREDNKYAA